MRISSMTELCSGQSYECLSFDIFKMKNKSVGHTVIYAYIDLSRTSKETVNLSEIPPGLEKFIRKKNFILRI